MATLKTIAAHILCLLSMALYAGNYVSMVVFNRYFSGFYFNIVRTIMTIPMVPFLIACDSLMIRPKAELLEDDDGSEQGALPREHSTEQRQQIESMWEGVSDERQSDAAHRDPLASTTVSDCCTTTAGVSTNAKCSSEILAMPPQDDALSEFCEATSQLAKKQTEVQKKTSCTPSLWSSCGPNCVKSSKTYDLLFFCYLSSLSRYKLHPKARWPVFISTVSGCVRQMIVPIALMFTTANAAGIIQPAVPVFSAFVAIAYGLEKFCWMTGLAILFCMVGLFISEEGWRFNDISIGFLLLLLVPVSKGFQIVGTHLAAPYHCSHVLQTYQITGLIVLTFPVAMLLELAIIRHWDVMGMITDMAKINTFAV